MTPAEVEDVATYYVMFFTRAGRQVRAAGVPHAVVRAGRRRAGHRGAVREARASRSARPIASGMFTLLEFECLGRLRPRARRDGEQRALARARDARRAARSWWTTSAQGRRRLHRMSSRGRTSECSFRLRAEERYDGTDSHQIRPRAEQLHARLLPEARGLRGAEEGARDAAERRHRDRSRRRGCAAAAAPDSRPG